MKVALYVRVSTNEQDTSSQFLALREYCETRGFQIFQEYIDRGVSGSKDSRPALNELMEDARKGRFKVILVFRFDRFARSTRHLLAALDEFQHLGIDFISYQENIDTTSPLGKAIFVIVGAVAELERNIIVERVKSGLNAARARGKILGRPKVSFNIDRALQLKREGLSLRSIEKQIGVSHSTLARAMNGVDAGAV